MSTMSQLARTVTAKRSFRGRRQASRTGTSPITPWLYLAIPLVLLLVFTYLPVLNMIGYSVTNWDGMSSDRQVVGVKNYVEMFTRPELFRVFFVSLYYLAASAVQMALALYFATMLSFNTRFRSWFKGIYFFPYLINGVAVGFVFLYFFKPGGTLDAVLSLVGVHNDRLWLGDPTLVNPSLAFVSLWRYVGLNFVLFLGAIQSIPAELYEAAELDGAGRWHQFRYIIAPAIKPIISLSFMLAISGSLAVFEVPFVMTGGANGSTTFVIQTVKQAFDFNKVGLASAAAVILLVIVLLVTWIQRRLVPEDRSDLV